MPASAHGLPIVQSLAGDCWRLRQAGRREWLPAIVPGCVHADLLRAGRIEDPFQGRNECALQWIEEADWTYATDFFVDPKLWRHEQIELHAEGLDTVATVSLNGTIIGRSENMFVAHCWAVKPRLKPGRNRLEIRFDSPMRYIRTRRLAHRPREINDPVGGCTRIRKQQCSFGWDWAPRLATCGVWRSIELRGWSGNRIESVRVQQEHRLGAVTLTLKPELAKASPGMTFRSQLWTDGELVAETEGLRLDVANPRLWWPNGQGDQALYTVRVEGRIDGRPADVWTRRIGLRTLALDRQRDKWGESFQFCINGRPIFAKGANWIPAHAFVAGLQRGDYEPLLNAAVAAHMNMIRVWGGGIYEHAAFYDLCDELGLLVWQDFMFSCTLYPGDRAFLRSVELEATQQVTRLRHHASLALWCGNNEVESLNEAALRASARARRDYDALFLRLLPRVVIACAGGAPYWPSSPAGSQNEGVPKDAARLTGDWHDWDVWHARHPVKAYEKSGARFVSEFGMQSFVSPAVAATFSPRTEWNIFAPTLEHHQKNPIGNAIVLDYVCRRYRFPRDYEALAYLSQLNQAYCMKVAVEHWRRNRPRTMGTLYWQLNDCWPVASWSSLEFGGRWKALHHAARRFFAPVLVSAHVRGDETRGIGNRLRSDIHGADIHVVSDHPEKVSAKLRWELWHLGRGLVLRRSEKTVLLQPGTARCAERLDLGDAITRHGREQLALRLELGAPDLPVSEDVVLLTAPRHLDLQPVRPTMTVRKRDEGGWSVRLRAEAYLHGVWLDLPGARFSVSDNAFDLLPGVPREIGLEVAGIGETAELEQRLVTRSLVDSYWEVPAMSRSSVVADA